MEKLTFDIPDSIAESLDDLAEEEGLPLPAFLRLLLLRAIGEGEEEIREKLGTTDLIQVPGMPDVCPRCGLGRWLHHGERVSDCLACAIFTIRSAPASSPAPVPANVNCRYCGQVMMVGVNHFCPYSTTNSTANIPMTGTFTNGLMPTPCPKCGASGLHNCPV